MTTFRIVFIHHSVGRQLLLYGKVREQLAKLSTPDCKIELFDHDYNRIGLTGADGQKTGQSFPLPGDDTDPPALAKLFTGAEADVIGLREKILSYDVIALKSCYPNSAIRSDEAERSRMDLYQQLIAAITRIPREFVLVTSPPLTPLRTSASQAARASRVARWLATDATAGAGNVSVFDLFHHLAEPSGRDAGMLRKGYRRALPFDSHPHERAWQQIAPQFAEALAAAVARAEQAATR
jgi:hypothetical protein